MFSYFFNKKKKGNIKIDGVYFLSLVWGGKKRDRILML